MLNTKSYTVTKTCCYLGYVCQAVCINLLPMLFIMFVENYGISYEQLGRLALISFITQLAGDFFAMRFIGRIGYRRVVVLAHATNLLMDNCGVTLIAGSLLMRPKEIKLVWILSNN